VSVTSSSSVTPLEQLADLEDLEGANEKSVAPRIIAQIPAGGAP
jgi:hypothetical protein